MKYCAQCGEMLEDGDIFCPNCGVKQQAEEAVSDAGSVGAAFADVYSHAPSEAQNEAPAEYPANAAQYAYGDQSYLPAEGNAPAKQKKKKKKGLIISLAIIGVLLACIAALFFTGAYTSLLPHSKLKLGLAEKKLYDKIVSSRQLQDIEADRFCFDISFDIDTNTYCDSTTESITDVLNKLDLQLNYDTVGNGIGITARYKNNPAADIRILCSEDELGFYLSPASDDYYTTTVESLMKRLDPNGEPGDVDFTVLFDKISMTGVRGDLDAIKAIAADALKEANVTIEKNVEVKLFNGEDAHKGAVYTITLSEQQMTALLNRIADYLDSDACYIKGFYNKQLSSPLTALLSDYTSIDVDFDDFDEFDDIGRISEDDMSFSKLIEQFREEIPEISKNYIEENIKLEVIMDGNNIIRQRIYYDDGAVGYDHYKNGNTERTLLYVADEASLDYTAVTEGARKVISAQLLDDDSETVLKATASIDTGSRSVIGTYVGNYSLTIMIDTDEEVVINMDVTNEDGGMMHRISYEFDEDEAYYSGIDSLLIKAVVSEGEGVSVPAGVDTKDISDYSDMKFSMLLMNLANKLTKELEDLFG